MNNGGASEITAKQGRERPDPQWVGPLRSVAVIALVAGAGGSAGLMLLAGHPPIFLRVLFTIWVVSPFMALLLANMISRRWPLIIRATLYGLMLAVTLSSLAIYGYVVFRPHELTPTATFVVVPPASFLLIAIVITIAGLISRRHTAVGGGKTA